MKACWIWAVFLNSKINVMVQSARLNLPGVNKFRNYEQLYLSGEWREDELADHMLLLVAFTEHTDAKSFRKNVIKR